MQMEDTQPLTEPIITPVQSKNFDAWHSLIGKKYVKRLESVELGKSWILEFGQILGNSLFEMRMNS